MRILTCLASLAGPHAVEAAGQQIIRCNRSVVIWARSTESYALHRRTQPWILTDSKIWLRARLCLWVVIAALLWKTKAWLRSWTCQLILQTMDYQTIRCIQMAAMQCTQLQSTRLCTHKAIQKIVWTTQLVQTTWSREANAILNLDLQWAMTNRWWPFKIPRKRTFQRPLTSIVCALVIVAWIVIKDSRSQWVEHISIRP